MCSLSSAITEVGMAMPVSLEDEAKFGPSGPAPAHLLCAPSELRARSWSELTMLDL